MPEAINYDDDEVTSELSDTADTAQMHASRRMRLCRLIDAIESGKCLSRGMSALFLLFKSNVAARRASCR